MFFLLLYLVRGICYISKLRKKKRAESARGPNAKCKHLYRRGAEAADHQERRESSQIPGKIIAGAGKMGKRLFPDQEYVVE